MEWSWQPKVMVVSFLSVLIKRLSQVPRYLEFWLWCLAILLAGMLAGCAGKRAKAPPVIAGPPVVEAPATPSDQRLREAIRSYMGTDYKYGGTSREGLDCSGFVMKAYERAGVKIPRSSELQYQHGEKVSPEHLRYGDLVFFNNYCYSKYSYATASILSGVFPKVEQPCHVGIYIGGGRFIHSTASQHGVTVSNLNADCWKRSLIGVRRYLPQ
jgi:cell wall-associated NlpC family hydrolase